MKLFSSLVALFVSAVAFNAPANAAHAPIIAGTWQGTATVRGGEQVPVTLRITGSGGALKLAMLNGPAEHPDESPASSVTFDGSHLIASYDYYARRLEATLADGKLTGTYASVDPAVKNAVSTPFTLSRVTKAVDPAAAPNAPAIRGGWEVETKSSKGESAWEFRVDSTAGKSTVIKTVIQRIDGDTGGLWGTWNGSSYIVGHFNASGTALFSITPLPDKTLKISNLIPSAHPNGDPTEWTARRPADARKEKLAAPTKTTEQTTVKDPSVPFAFSFPDLAGKTVSNTDAEFQGKVVIVAIGGSWCPNCHDEAPLLESLYKKYHSKGLEVVNLDFEQEDSATDTARLKAFIAHYGITYRVLVSGTTDQLNEKIPQGVNLNSWPTSFFLGRDGRVKETHAGFAGPGNAAGHEALVKETTELIEKLLAEPAAVVVAQAK